MFCRTSRIENYDVYTIECPKSTISTPETQTATCLMIDVSGSMHGEATIVNDDGDRVSHGFSILDVAKHSAIVFAQKSIGHYLCVGHYSDAAIICQDWILVSTENIDMICENIHRLHAFGATNFTSALNVGMLQILNCGLPQEKQKQVVTNFVILTDGQPSVHLQPARGKAGYKKMIVESKNSINEVKPNIVPCITAIAIGNNVDSELLEDISDHFLHMPDPGSIGSVIVNLLASLQSVATVEEIPLKNASISFTKDVNILGETVPTRLSCIHQLKYDDIRFIFVKADGPYEALVSINGITYEPVKRELNNHYICQENLEKHILANKIRQCLCNQMDINNFWEPKYDNMVGTSTVKEVINGLTNFRETWGKPYARMLSSALIQNKRVNFRDELLLFEESTRILFSSVTNKSETIFGSTIAPSPSLKQNAGVTPSSLKQNGCLTQSMPDEFLRGGGCFGKDSYVETIRFGKNMLLQIKDIVKGDIIRSEHGVTRVVCVIEQKNVEVISFNNGLEITPTHPFKLNQDSKYVHPITFSNIGVLKRTTVFNLVVENRESILVNNVICVTLGHNFKDNITRHDFYGTDKVVNSLKKMRGWNYGYINITREIELHMPLVCKMDNTLNLDASYNGVSASSFLIH